MNYGTINPKRIDEDAQLICDCIGHGKYGTAKDMIKETAIAETGLGQIEDKTIGAGMGITQFDELPFNDIKNRCIKLKPQIQKDLKIDISLVEWDDLRYNQFLALLFTRLLYWLAARKVDGKYISIPIPATIEERAAYWKEFCNTPKGKGTVEHYLEMNRKYKV